MSKETTIFERRIDGVHTRRSWYVLSEGCAAHLWISSREGQESFGGIEIHSPTRMYESQEPRPCMHVKGGQCYHDGTSLGAEEYVRAFDNEMLTDEEAFAAARPYLRRVIDEQPTPATPATPVTETEA